MGHEATPVPSNNLLKNCWLLRHLTVDRLVPGGALLVSWILFCSSEFCVDASEQRLWKSFGLLDFL